MARVSGDPDEHDLERTALLALLRGVTTPRPTSP